MNAPSLLPMILQQSLQRAYPSPLPSNMVLTAIAGPYGGADAGSTVTGTAWTVSGFVWGGPGVDPGWAWGESGEWSG